MAWANCPSRALVTSVRAPVAARRMVSLSSPAAASRMALSTSPGLKCSAEVASRCPTASSATVRTAESLSGFPRAARQARNTRDGMSSSPGTRVVQPVALPALMNRSDSSTSRRDDDRSTWPKTTARMPAACPATRSALCVATMRVASRSAANSRREGTEPPALSAAPSAPHISAARSFAKVLCATSISSSQSSSTPTVAGREKASTSTPTEVRSPKDCSRRPSSAPITRSNSGPSQRISSTTFGVAKNRSKWRSPSAVRRLRRALTASSCTDSIRSVRRATTGRSTAQRTTPGRFTAASPVWRKRRMLALRNRQLSSSVSAACI
mmetsp:Transcript_27065/g.75630  ORF Transcript_27065/g.75630 Transcript_27065/m.75630 type:complete len:325 (-) Transcript_27065:60-1034(-)